MPSSLDSTEARRVLDRLRAIGQARDPEYKTRMQAREAEIGEKLYGRERAEIGAEAPLAIAPEVGAILYTLTITKRPG